MVEQRCKIVGEDPRFKDAVLVIVPGYYSKGRPLPARMAILYRPAAEALDAAMIEIAAAGGHLYISDMFRSKEDQDKAHADYLSGRKHAYSPPSGASMHEAARAIDIDPGDTLIGLAAVKAILKKHCWIGIADRGSECWHHDWRGPDGQAAYESAYPGMGGMSRYRAMAKYCIDKLGYSPMSKPDDTLHANRVAWIQGVLNFAFPVIAKKNVFAELLLKEGGGPVAARQDRAARFELIDYSDPDKGVREYLKLMVGPHLVEPEKYFPIKVDGIYGGKTQLMVKVFQESLGLERDGIVGPITEKALSLESGMKAPAGLPATAGVPAPAGERRMT